MDRRIKSGGDEEVLAFARKKSRAGTGELFTSPRVRGEVERSEGEGAFPRF